MKILFLGPLRPGQTSRMRMEALKRLGHEVQGVDTVEPWLQTSKLGRLAGRYLQQGPVVDQINRSVLQAARSWSPDLIWGEKQEFLRPDTLKSLKSTGARLAHYTPDPYFSLTWKRTRLMDQGIGLFDVLVYCKTYERAQYEALGKPLIYMPLGYCDEVHRPLPSADPRWSCAVGFLGGWEPRREAMLHALAVTGVDLKIWGGYWEFLADGRWSLRRQVILSQLAGEDPFRFHRDPLLTAALQGGEVYADDYARALSGSRIGVGFLRKVVPDQHTTRSFEIPACGSMLIADRTDEHRALFEEGLEAEFFGSVEEMVDKVGYYAAHEPRRAAIAAAGRQRCIDSRYAYIHRLADALGELAKL